MRYAPMACSRCGVTFDRNRQARACPHGVPDADFSENRDTMCVKIFVYSVPGGLRAGDVIGYSIAEDGAGLAQHLSSNAGFSRFDMGITSEHKHDDYLMHSFPFGFELEWLDYDALDTHVGFQAAYTLNQAKHVG